MRLSLRFSQKVISAIGCGNGNAGRQLGCEHAATVIRNSEFMKNLGFQLKWKQVIEETVSGRHLEALPGVLQTCSALATETSKSIENGEELFVLGGDHSCAIGTWSGVAKAMRPKGDIGLIWVDAHMDAHTTKSSPSGNVHGMPVAHLLGYGDSGLVSIGDSHSKILPENFCMVGIRSYEQEEQDLIEKLGIRVFFIDEVQKRGLRDVMHEAHYHVNRNTVGFGLSIDIDGFDTTFAPAVGTPEANGMDAREFMKSLLSIDLTTLLAAEIVEFLPRFDDQHKTSEKLVSNLVDVIFSTKFHQQQILAKIYENASKSTQTHRRVAY